MGSMRCFETVHLEEIHLQRVSQTKQVHRAEIKDRRSYRRASHAKSRVCICIAIPMLKPLELLLDRALMAFVYVGSRTTKYEYSNTLIAKVWVHLFYRMLLGQASNES